MCLIMFLNTHSKSPCPPCRLICESTITYNDIIRFPGFEPFIFPTGSQDSEGQNMCSWNTCEPVTSQLQLYPLVIVLAAVFVCLFQQNYSQPGPIPNGCVLFAIIVCCCYYPLVLPVNDVFNYLQLKHPYGILNNHHCKASAINNQPSSLAINKFSSKHRSLHIF